MSQSAREDLERGNRADGDQTQSATDQQSRDGPSFGDSSGPFFSMYSNAAEEEDNKMVKRWQKDADGILIFTGLFSAAVAALLGVTVQDLRPNSQDTSAFYLGNIYEVLADPNATRASIPSPVAKPPPFSRPRYAVWVNSLWFLSLVMSLSCALLATSLHQWARRYIRLTQPARRTPEKRARIRAFYADGVDKMHIPWAVEGLPTLLHISVFMFFGGLAIFLFNVDEEVFTCVVCWIGLFSVVYGLITLLPSIRLESPYYTPLSKPVWFLYARILHLILFSITSCYDIYDRPRRRHLFWRNQISSIQTRYRLRMVWGMEKAAENMAAKQSSEIDIRILGWTIKASGDDDSLEKLFEAIPGLFNSKIVGDLERNFPYRLRNVFGAVLYGFMRRTSSSNSVKESAKSRRVNIFKDIASIIPFSNWIYEFIDQEPVPIERVQVMTRWRANTSHVISNMARLRVAENLARIQDRDGRWIALASEVSGLSEDDLRHDVGPVGDNMVLATMIKLIKDNISRPDLHITEINIPFRAIEGPSGFNIRNTSPGPQHDFCKLWNELVQEARNRGPHTIPVEILCEIRQLYISLHQGTDAAPTAFSASTSRADDLLYQPSSYPLCNISSHRPDSAAHVPVLDTPAVPRHVKEAFIIAGPSLPSDPTTTSKIGDSSPNPAAAEPTIPAHFSPHSTDALPIGAVAATLQYTYLEAESSHTLDGTTHREIVTAGAASAYVLPASSVVSSPIPAFRPPSHVPPLPDAEYLVFFSSSTTPSRPSGDATLPRLRARGLVNTGGMNFANAVLQMLVHSPPFWNLIRELGDLKRQQRGAVGPESGGDAVPLVDATVRLFEEFAFKEKKSYPTQVTQPSAQQAAAREPMGDERLNEEQKVADTFEPTYMYNAIKAKRQLKKLMDDKNEDAKEFLSLYLDALDGELIDLHTYISTHKPASVPNPEEDARSLKGLAEVRKRDHTASSVESPISRIFGGRSRSTARAPNQSDNVTTEAWRSLQLNIQPNLVHTIGDALSNISQRQSMHVGQSSSNKATQQVLLEEFPPILVLHLERFLYDVATEGMNKISKPVQFGPELEIPLEIMAPVSGKSAEQIHYKLHGVLYHRGESAGSGHYTVDVLHSNGDGGSGESWLHIDDEAVKVVQHEEVFGGHDGDRVDDTHNDQLSSLTLRLLDRLPDK